MIWTDEICAYVETPAFQARCCELFDRIEAGECFTLADAAELVGLPWAAFREVFACYLAAAGTTVEIESATLH